MASRSKVVKVGLTQMSCSPDVEDNRFRQLNLLHRCADQGAQILCTQELFTTQYFCQVEDHRFFELAEPIPGPTTDPLPKLVSGRGVVVIASLFERRSAGLYHNTAAVIDADGSLMGIYRKMHIPDDPLYFEKFYFTPGDTGFRTWQTQHGAIGVLICWDQWFPEGARLTAIAGAQILFYPTAIGWHPSEKAEFGRPQHESWELMMRSHAVANGCFVCAPNRIGGEAILAHKGTRGHRDGLEYWGQSFVPGPGGEVMVRAGDDHEQTLLAECDMGTVEVAPTHWPFPRDRRIDAYGDLCRRFIDQPA